MLARGNTEVPGRYCERCCVLTSRRAKRVSGPEKFRSSARKDFFNTIRHSGTHASQHVGGGRYNRDLPAAALPRECRSRMTRCRRAASSILSPASCKSYRSPDQGIRLGVAEESPGSGQLPQTGPPRSARWSSDPSESRPTSRAQSDDLSRNGCGFRGPQLRLHGQLTDLASHLRADLSRKAVVEAGIDARHGDLVGVVVDAGPRACYAWSRRARHCHRRYRIAEHAFQDNGRGCGCDAVCAGVLRVHRRLAQRQPCCVARGGRISRAV
jgi:hypothetical protein